MICETCRGAADSVAAFQAILRDEVLPKVSEEEWEKFVELVAVEVERFGSSHSECRGSTWCDCAHRVSINFP